MLNKYIDSSELFQITDKNNNQIGTLRLYEHTLDTLKSIENEKTHITRRLYLIKNKNYKELINK